MKFKILDKCVIIAGFKNVNVPSVDEILESIQKETKSQGCVQIFDAKLIAGPEHLYFATLNALNAFKRGFNISRNLAVEVLLFSSAQHQINKAVNMMGIKQDTTEVGVSIITDDDLSASALLEKISRILNGEQDDTVLNITKEKMKLIKKEFKISSLEMESASRGSSKEDTLRNLIIERMALLPARR